MEKAGFQLLARERALFVGALIVGIVAASLGVPVDFVLFAITLAGVALFHHHTLYVALTGLAVITLYKLGFSEFRHGPGLGGLGKLLAHEWVILTNLLGLLLGFALLSKHFEDSKIPAVLPKFLPDDWKGGFALLVIVFVLSSFLDNIAAALIGGTMAGVVFRGKVHIGYLAGIVACSNAGGAAIVSGPARELPDQVAARIRETCKRVYRNLMPSGYARSDLRLLDDGVPCIMEANPNPQLSSDEDFADSARAAGVEYHSLVPRIVDLGLRFEPSRLA